MHELVDKVRLAHVRGQAAQLPVGRVGNKKPTQKTHPKQIQKNTLKNSLKMLFFGGFLGFFKFLRK